MFHPISHKGFTLIELIAVIVILGILATIAATRLAPVAETMKIEETRREMDNLAVAIFGNPDLHNNGIRSDFGYVGDIGALPPNLDALKSNPGLATWNGPYVENDLEQTPDDFKKDAWQSDYIYSGTAITSIGSGSSISRQLAASADHILYNSFSGAVYDLDGTPPGNNFRDSVTVQLTIPDGIGGMITRISSVDGGGYFNFDSIPIGNHDLKIGYSPSGDTLRRFVSVLANSAAYGEYYFGSDLWNTGGNAGGSGLEFVDDSDTLASGNCSKLIFWISNNTGNSITISSLTPNWNSPTAYYKTVKWGAAIVRSGTPALGSGETAFFGAAQTISDGEQIQIQVEQFHDDPGGGGSPVDMSGASFTVDFSDGSSVTFTADLCI